MKGKQVSGDCIFCKIANGEFGTKFIYEDEDLLAFHDINPQAPVHVLIIPRKHISRVNQLNDSNLDLAGNMILAANKIAQDEKISESG